LSKKAFKGQEYLHRTLSIWFLSRVHRYYPGEEFIMQFALFSVIWFAASLLLLAVLTLV